MKKKYQAGGQTSTGRTTNVPSKKKQVTYEKTEPKPGEGISGSKTLARKSGTKKVTFTAEGPKAPGFSTGKGTKTVTKVNKAGEITNKTKSVSDKKAIRKATKFGNRAKTTDVTMKKGGSVRRRKK